MKALSKLKSNKRGSITIFVGIGVISIIAFGALITDLGMTYIRANQLQNTADSAALAATKNLPLTNNASNIAFIKSEAVNYAKVNGENPINTTIEPLISTDNKYIIGAKVSIEGTAKYSLSAIIGESSGKVTRSATARIFSVSEIASSGGLIPIGINQDQLKDPGFSGIDLAIDPSDANAVKYGWLYFDKVYSANENSNSNLKNWMSETGYDGTISIGDQIPWTNGSRASTIMAYNDLEGKYVVVPVYEIVSYSEGGKKEDTGMAKITGFVVAKIEPLKSGEKSNKNMRATFVKYYTSSSFPGDGDIINDFRVYGLRLVA